MRPLLYFVPGAVSLGEHNLDNVGLSHLRGAQFSNVEVFDSPTQARGCVCAVTPPKRESDRGLEAGYYKDRQTWTEGPDGKYWIGYYTSAKPGPDDLCRDEQIKGHATPMRDGAKWVVPAVRLAGGGTGLPQGLGLDAKRNVVIEDLPEYADIQTGADLIFAWANEERGALDWPEATRIVGRCLGLNYFVDEYECVALKLFTKGNLAKCAYAIIDQPTRDEWIAAFEVASKKNASADTPAGSDTVCGATASSPDTGQPTQICGSNKANGE